MTANRDNSNSEEKQVGLPSKASMGKDEDTPAPTAASVNQHFFPPGPAVPLNGAYPPYYYYPPAPLPYSHHSHVSSVPPAQTSGLEASHQASASSIDHPSPTASHEDSTTATTTPTYAPPLPTVPPTNHPYSQVPPLPYPPQYYQQQQFPGVPPSVYPPLPPSAYTLPTGAPSYSFEHQPPHQVSEDQESSPIEMNEKASNGPRIATSPIMDNDNTTLEKEGDSPNDVLTSLVVQQETTEERDDDDSDASVENPGDLDQRCSSSKEERRLKEHEQQRIQKNKKEVDRSNEIKIEIARILAIPEGERGKGEQEYLQKNLDRKKRKSKTDRARRERMQGEEQQDPFAHHNPYPQYYPQQHQHPQFPPPYLPQFNPHQSDSQVIPHYYNTPQHHQQQMGATVGDMHPTTKLDNNTVDDHRGGIIPASSSMNTDPGTGTTVHSDIALTSLPLCPKEARRFKKNAKSREQAAQLKQQIKDIQAKSPSQRTDEEHKIFAVYEERRLRKNTRSKERAVEVKAEIKRIQLIPEEKRTEEEKRFFTISLQRKQNKNEGDRARRQAKQVKRKRQNARAGGNAPSPKKRRTSVRQAVRLSVPGKPNNNTDNTTTPAKRGDFTVTPIPHRVAMPTPTPRPSEFQSHFSHEADVYTGPIIPTSDLTTTTPTSATNHHIASISNEDVDAPSVSHHHQDNFSSSGSTIHHSNSIVDEFSSQPQQHHIANSEAIAMVSLQQRPPPSPIRVTKTYDEDD